MAFATRTSGPVLAIATILALSQGPLPQARQATASAWPQWGGPNRNFMSDSKGLASKWPASGPKKVWSRALGEGHSAIVVEGGRLYTMYRPLGLMSMVRRSQEEVIAALDAATGATIWEHRYPSSTSGIDFSEGAGPHSTPLVTADRVFAAGSRKELFASNGANGQVEARDPRRGRQSRTRDGDAGGTAGPRQGAGARESRVDAAHARGNSPLRSRPEEHRELRAGFAVT